VSIRLAIYPDDAADGVSLLRHADRALYSAKEHGRNRVVSIGTAAAQSTT
jgi:GGDEF domain-containing protein